MKLRAAVLSALAFTWAFPAGAAEKAEAAKSESAKQPAKSDRQAERGRYLAKIAGCNDCHTPGYAMSGGKVPEKDWLVGDQLGWHGPWGTTYPANLRLYVQKMSEDEWVQKAKTLQTRPPMPWFALHDMTTGDLRALYRFMKYLGPAGNEAPAFVPPDQKPKQPYVDFPSPPPSK